MTKPRSQGQQLLELLSLTLEELMPDPNQPRKTFVTEAIERLAKSIAARGVLTPLRVRWDEQRHIWIIITGESRWRAARLAGLASVPCLPVSGELSDTDNLADQITENALRQALRPMEEARAITRLKALMGVNSQTLAAELGLSNSSITRAEALLSLPEAIQAMVDDGRVPESAAYEISRLPDEAGMFELAHAVVSGRMSRDSVAAAVRSRIGKRNVQPKGSKFACTLEGVSFSLSAGKQALTPDLLLKALDQLRREVKKLSEGGSSDIEALGKTLRVSS